MITVGPANLSDLDEIFTFIEQTWDKNHIFLKDRQIFDYQHVNLATGKVSFFILKIDGKLWGILGYLSCSKWDRFMRSNRLFLTMWSVDPRCPVPAAGLHLLRAIQRAFPSHELGAIGLSPIASKIYEGMGWHLGEMQHVAAFPGSRASGGLGPSHRSMRLEPVNFKHLNAFYGKRNSRKWKKSSLYMTQKYGNHPHFLYQLFELSTDFSQCLVVTREQRGASGSVLRLVDADGDLTLLEHSGTLWSTLCFERGLAYFDLMAYGLDRNNLLRGGFLESTRDFPSGFPSKFDPYISAPAKILVGLSKQLAPGEVLFRGDSDQDRPNTEEGLVT